MTYVTVYLVGQPDQPVACVCEDTANAKYVGDSRYVLSYYKPPRR